MSRWTRESAQLHSGDQMLSSGLQLCEALKQTRSRLWISEGVSCTSSRHQS